MAEQGIELAAAVAAIRAELEQAAAEGAASPLRFEVGPIALEFEVELRREAKAGGGVKAWVVNAEAGGSSAHGTRQKVAFTLTPRAAAGGGSVEIGNPAPAPDLSNFAPRKGDQR